MSLVPQDSRLSPRVVPKVFADVPSASELAAAQSSRTALVAVVALLVGMLLVTGAGAAWLFQSNQALTTESEKVAKEQADKIVALQTELTKQQEESAKALAGLKRQFDVYNTTYGRVETAKAQWVEAKAQLDAQLSSKPSAQKKFAAKLAAPGIQNPRWDKDSADALRNLEADVAALNALVAEVTVWNPPVAAGGGPIFNPN